MVIELRKEDEIKEISKIKLVVTYTISFMLTVSVIFGLMFLIVNCLYE